MKKNLILACGLAAFAGVASADTYSNGPLVTDPGAGFGGKDASVLQTALGLNVFGFGHNNAIGIRVADDFVVPSGETWKVSGFSFFSYQTGMTTTTPTFTKVNVGVWNATPNGIPGTGNVFANADFALGAGTSTWTGAYRVTDTALTGATRPLWKNKVTLGTPISLAAGTYWVDWSTAGSLASGPWCPPVTIKGQTGKAGANSVQFIPLAQGGTDAWLPIIDNGAAAAAQDMAFEVEYTKETSGCYPDCDGDTVLSIDDFICFQTFFALNDPYADCDGDTALSIDDFICFQTFFAIGC